MGKIERAIGKEDVEFSRRYECLKLSETETFCLTGLKLRGKDIGEPLEAKPKKK